MPEPAPGGMAFLGKDRDSRGPRLCAALLVILLAGLAACSRGAVPCSPSASTTLRVAIANPLTTKAAGKDILPPGILTDLPLIDVDDLGLPQPGLASSWTTTDRQTWTLTLRDDLRTHAGVPLTAERIRARLMERVESRRVFDPVSRDLLRIDVPDASTLIVHLRRPTSAFAEGMARMGLAGDAGEPALAAGPFRLVESGEARMAFERFPAARPGDMGVSALSVMFYPSARGAWAAFLRNDADLLYDVPAGTASLLARNPDVQIFPAGGRHAYVLTFQQKHPRLRDPRVRQAISLAIDREEIARSVLGGYARPTAGPFTPYYWAVEGLAPEGPYDPAAARRLLREAAGGRDQPLELICLTSVEFPLVADVAAALEVQLARVNITLRLVPLDLEAIETRLRAGDFDLAAFPIMVGSSTLWPYIFWHSSTPSPYIKTGYNAADAALDALYTASSAEAERQAARHVVEVMRRDPPAAFILPVPIIRAVRRSWRVPTQTPEARDVRETLSRWTLAGGAPCAAS